MSDEDFYREYERLAEQGFCDAPGGMEYERVLGEWKSAGCPPYMEEFIRCRANWIPRREDLDEPAS